MKSFIIYEKDKSLADFLSAYYIKKKIGNDSILKQKKIEELSSTSLFSIGFDNVEDDEIVLNEYSGGTGDDDDSVSPWELGDDDDSDSIALMLCAPTVHIVHIQNKNDSDNFVRSMSNGELLHRVERDYYCFIFTHVESSHSKNILKWADSNNVKIVSPILLDKHTPQVTVSSLAKQYGLDREHSKILSLKAGKNYGLVVPFLKAMEDKDFASLCVSLSGKDFDRFVDSFLPTQKPERIPPWDWKKCFSEKTFEGFSLAILAVEKDCGDVVLIRTMYKDLTEWARVKMLQESGFDLYGSASAAGNIRLDSYAKIVLNKMSLTAADLFALSEITISAYDSIMSGAQNKKTLTSTMIIKMWNIVGR